MELFLEFISWLVPWPSRREGQSTTGESELDRQARIFKTILLGIVIAVALGVGVWWYFYQA